MTHPLEIAAIVWGDRHFPAAEVTGYARALADSGVVDGMHFADQLVNFIPSQLWTTDNTPMAAVLPDLNSHPDAFVTAAYALAAAPELAISISTDSVRHPPAELVQTMLTLANLTQGRATFHVGAGENKQCGPFGHDRSTGLSRMKDLFRIFHALWDADGPVDVAGRRTTLTRASLGGAKNHRPRVWGLGGGPTLLDHTTSYADGLNVALPSVWATPAEAADQIAAVRADLERKGRDPAAFRFGGYLPMLLHDDPEVLARAFDNPLVTLMTAAFGRVDPHRWADVGLASPVPEGWTYFADLLPLDTPDAFLEQTLRAVTREHVRAGWVIGSPAQAAAWVEPFVAAGISWILPMDYLPLLADPARAPEAFDRTIAFCRSLKQLCR